MRPQQQDIGLPKQFIDAHLNQHQLMRMLGCDEPQFFAAYLAGEIPPGVTMTEFLDLPLICWPKADIQRWINAGKPAHQELADRRARVLMALRTAIEIEHGTTLEDLAAGMLAATN